MYVGGTRARLIDDSVYRFINEGLTELGWFLTGRANAPVFMTDQEIDPETTGELLDNTLSIQTADSPDEAEEMGSDRIERTITYYLDLYGENLSTAKHIANDIRDYIDGRFSFQQGNPRKVIPVYDNSLATPSVIFYVQVDRVEVNRSRFYEKQYNRFWYMITLHVTDSYETEDDPDE